MNVETTTVIIEAVNSAGTGGGSALKVCCEVTKPVNSKISAAGSSVNTSRNPAPGLKKPI